MRTWLKALPLLFFPLAPQTYAQQTAGLTQVAQINLQEHPDSFRLFSGSDEDHGRRAPLFSVAVAPDGDLLALVAKQSGPWHVVRVKNWLGPKPVVEHLDVPGYSTPLSAGDFSIKPQLMVTPNGRYLVTVVPEPWPQGKDATVDVVDLQTFHLVTTQRTLEHGLGGDWQLDAKGGFLQVHGLTPNPSTPVGSEQWLAFLSLPGLQPLERCDYSVVFNPPNSVPVLRAEFYGTPNPACAREAQRRLTHQNEPDELQRLGGLLKSACGIDAATPDHHYALGTCRDCHQGLFGVSCKSEKSDVYDVASEKKIANLSHASHQLTEALLTSSQDKLYLLAIENAEKLVAYQVTASP